MPALRRVVHAFRYANDQLLAAGDAIIRSSRAPQPRPQSDAAAGMRAHPVSMTERTDRAA